MWELELTPRPSTSLEAVSGLSRFTEQDLTVDCSQGKCSLASHCDLTENLPKTACCLVEGLCFCFLSPKVRVGLSPILDNLTPVQESVGT